MASQTESSAADDKLTSRDAVRIPRLTYRNRLPQNSTDTIEPVSKPALDAQPVFPGNERRADPAQRQVSAATSLESDLVGGRARPSSATTPGKPNRPTSADAFAQRRSDSIAVDKKDKKAKKSKLRGISLLGYLAVKEPSAHALEHFARQELRRAEAKGSISVASKSHQKMPEGVPKVNTQWDGLPEAVRTRPGTSTDRHSTVRSFSSSRLSTATEDSKRSKSSTSTTSTTSTIDFALRTPSVEEISPRPVNLSSARQDSGTGSEAVRPRTGGLTSGAVRFAQPHPNISEVAPWAEPPF